jgi:hypothetical protein
MKQAMSTSMLTTDQKEIYPTLNYFRTEEK